MPALFAKDSKGNPQYILTQEFNTSCGPASVAMAEDNYKQACMVDPEGLARQLSQKYPGNWTIAGGSDVTNLSDVLNAEGVKADKAVYVGPALVYSFLAVFARETTPVIIHISWTPSGGHFVVCKQIDPDGTVVFLDPWYGLVEVAGGTLPAYNPSGTTGQTSGWLVITRR